MLNFLKFYYFRFRGANLMGNWVRVVEELGESAEFDKKIEQAESLCPIIKNYRVRAVDYAKKAKFFKIQHVRGGHFD